MTLADLAIVAVMVVSGVLALMRGFTREVFSILSWAGAAFATLWLFPPLLPTGRALLGFIPTQWIADGITAVVIFVAVLVLLSYLTGKATEKLRGAEPGPFDGTAGFIFGLARGFVVVCLAYLFYGMVAQPRDTPKWIANSMFLPLIEDTNNAFLELVTKAEENIPQNPAMSGPTRSDRRAERGEDGDEERGFRLFSGNPRRH